MSPLFSSKEIDLARSRSGLFFCIESRPSDLWER